MTSSWHGEEFVNMERIGETRWGQGRKNYDSCLANDSLARTSSDFFLTWVSPRQNLSPAPTQLILVRLRLQLNLTNINCKGTFSSRRMQLWSKLY